MILRLEREKEGNWLEAAGAVTSPAEVSMCSEWGKK